MTTELMDRGDAASEAQPHPAAPGAEVRNPFLVALGERVRTLRSRRGMTRKAVALAADVSERHLANLEYGTGNASILVLLQVTQALHCTLAELLGDITTSSPEWLLIRELLEHRNEADLRRARQSLAELFGAGGDERARHARIALIGLRGAGKSTLGKRLADDLGYAFIELSREIEKFAGCGISEIHLPDTQPEERLVFAVLRAHGTEYPPCMLRLPLDRFPVLDRHAVFPQTVKERQRL